MRRLLKVLGGVVVVLVVLLVIVTAFGGARTDSPAPPANDGGALSLASSTFARREGDYAAFLVTFANTTDAPIDNPQLRVVVDHGEQTFSCPGYFDTVSDEVVAGMDPVTRPLVAPANAETPATILCRMPDAPMDGAVVRLR